MPTATQHDANVKHLASTGSKLTTAFTLIFLTAPALAFLVMVIGFGGLVAWTAVFG